jgi:hypothetical protein
MKTKDKEFQRGSSVEEKKGNRDEKKDKIDHD